MEQYSEQDLKYAAEFREGVHREALERIRRLHPEIEAVEDRWPVEAYFQRHWDYPGKWYAIVAIPEECESRKALIDAIVSDTLKRHGVSAAERKDCPVGAKRRCDGSPRAETEASRADDPFYAVLAEYPRCVIDYGIAAGRPLPRQGCEAHREALGQAFRKQKEDGWEWSCDVAAARGKQIDPAALFAPARRRKELNYRGAFLYPPHEVGYTDADFDRVNAALFPNGTDELEVFAWTTDWSDYFDDGHEWWGALCLTVYDKSLDRFVVILASATD